MCKKILIITSLAIVCGSAFGQGRTERSFDFNTSSINYRCARSVQRSEGYVLSIEDHQSAISIKTGERDPSTCQRLCRSFANTVESAREEGRAVRLSRVCRSNTLNLLVMELVTSKTCQPWQARVSSRANPSPNLSNCRYLHSTSGSSRRLLRHEVLCETANGMSVEFYARCMGRPDAQDCVNAHIANDNLSTCSVRGARGNSGAGSEALQ